MKALEVAPVEAVVAVTATTLGPVAVSVTGVALLGQLGVFGGTVITRKAFGIFDIPQ